MSVRIESVYYFDYTKEIGFYDSIRNFTSLEMEFIAMAVSTEKVQVNSTPMQFIVDAEGTEEIREYVVSEMKQLVEISGELAFNSPRYIMIRYADDSEKYFKYDKEFCNIFSMARRHMVVENSQIPSTQEESPYALQKKQSVDLESYEGSRYSQSASNKYNSQDTTNSNTKNNDKAFWIKFFVGILIILGFVAMIINGMSRVDGANSLISDDSNLTPVTEPNSGDVLAGCEIYGASAITVSASAGESCVVKLKTISGTTRLCFYVRAGDTVTMGVPSEELYVYFASGDTWYGLSNLFGKYTSYSMDDEITDFRGQFEWEYTLYPVKNGNFSETPIDASDF